eukprot:TRINITY_DN9655_c0_g1_i1.p1 TRINITY_DN9655_c0_g1~~TRINITY_DN9655_c0_g1_i1.p1  ORF type:complete len:1003 (-),score=184.35 TRINITY_DN9655_c0_g1_i1:88-3096(-)
MKLFGRTKEAAPKDRSNGSGAAAGGVGGGANLNDMDDASREAVMKMLLSGPGNEDMLRKMGVDVNKHQQNQAQPTSLQGMPAYEPLDPAAQQRILEELGISDGPASTPGQKGTMKSVNANDMGKGNGVSSDKGLGKGFGKKGGNPAEINEAANAVMQALLAQIAAGGGMGLPAGLPQEQGQKGILQLSNGGGGHDGGIGKGGAERPSVSERSPLTSQQQQQQQQQQQSGEPQNPMAFLSQLLQNIGGNPPGLSSLGRSHDPSVPKFPVKREPIKIPGSKKALADIKRDCVKDPFVDEDFPPAFNEHVKKWCRPAKIEASDFKPVKPGSQWYLFRQKPSTADVRQGMLGDCWLLSSLAALAEYRNGRYVKDLLPGQGVLCPEGVYLVRFCLAGIWREILVDDRVPCVGGDPPYATHPAYAHTVQRQLWVSMVEKAFAKVCGCYDALSGGEASEALTVFTGWPCKVIQPPGKGVNSRGGGDMEADVEVMWTELVASKKAGFLLTCTTGYESPEMEKSGLESQHVYALIDVFEVKDKAGKQARLLKIRNPQGEGTDKEWTGAWSKDSSKWSPKLRETLGYTKDSAEGTFVICLEDFQRFYDHCTICQIRSGGWSESRVSLQLPHQTMPLTGLMLEISEAVDVVLMLHQAEKRMRYGPFYKGSFEPLACIGFAVLNADGPGVNCIGTQTALAVARMRHRPWVTAECNLEPGRYFIVPLSLTRGSYRHVACCCRSSGKVSLKSTKLDPSVARLAWAAYAKYEGPDERGNTRKSTQDECDLFLTQGDGAGIVGLVENRGSHTYKADLSIMSQNMRFSRGSPTTADFIPPGMAMILQVALPAMEETQVGWMGGPLLSKIPMVVPPPHHSPELNEKAGNADLHAPFQIKERDYEAEAAAKTESAASMMKMLKEMDVPKAKEGEKSGNDSSTKKPKEKSAARGLFDSMVAEQMQRLDGPVTPGVRIEELQDDVSTLNDAPPAQPPVAVKPAVRFFPCAMTMKPRPTCIVSL